VATSHGWTPGSGTMSPADMAAVLRAAATQVQAGGAATATLSSADLATLLRQASGASSSGPPGRSGG
jgi:hypothetical protein